MESLKQEKGTQELSMEDIKKATSSNTDSSISMTFDSAVDCGYKSGEINSPQTSESISSITDSNLQDVKLDQSITFDSGLVSDCFLPSSIDICVEKTETSQTESSKVKEKYLLEDIFSQDKDGDTILHLAIVEARSDIIFPLIQLAPHPDFLDITNDLFQTSLHLATLTGKSNIVRRLVVAGATLDIQDHSGNIPLHIAARRGDLDCVQAMLAPITEAEVEAAQCSYPIYLQDPDLSYLINMKNYDGQSCIHLAASGGFLKVMECLYNNHANINDQDGKTGRTPLHYAIENANFKLVELLLSKCHADSQLRNYAGQTPSRLAYSLRKRNPSKDRQDIVSFLKMPSDESSSEYDSDDSTDEVDIESMLSNSRDLTDGKSC